MITSPYLSSRVSASMQFGDIVHRVAVRVGSKTQLGAKIGVGKDVIQSITKGDAHTHDSSMLLDLVLAVEKEVHPDDHSRMLHLVATMMETQMMRES